MPRGDAHTPLRVVIDSREQAPFTFNGLPVETVVRGLRSGDYSIEGFEDAVTIERKSVPDLLSCMTSSRSRFEAELARLDEYEYACVLVEEPFNVLFTGSTRMHPKSIAATYAAWETRFRSHWHFAPCRSWAERTCYLLLERFARDVREGKRPTPAGRVAG